MDRADPPAVVSGSTGPTGPTVSVELVHSPAARQVEMQRLILPGGASVADALRAAGHGDVLAQEAPPVGIWGRRCAPSQVLREGDRVELYRPLQVDPKEARRLRYRQHREVVEAREAAARARKLNPR